MSTRFFGTDGIRDLAGEGRLAPEHVARAGRALARFAVAAGAASPRVCIGRDPRPSGERLTLALAGALAQGGATVEDLGVVPSPVVAWSVVDGAYDLGIAVSASHNPPAYNGIKPFSRGGEKLTVADEERIEALMLADDGAEARHVALEAVGGAQRYVAATAAWLGVEGDLAGRRLVVDLSAGAATTTAPAVLEALGADVRLLHEAGSRPINDGCGSEHPEAWQAAVRSQHGIGIAFDGDADRVLLADEDGEILDGHDALMILAQDRQARGCLPGSVVVSTIMANLGLEERLGALGVRLERTAVGDRNVAVRMRETGAALGGEPSGHVVLERDGALIGDALVAAVRVIQAAGRLGRSLGALRRETPRHPQLLVNVRVRERRPIAELGDLAGAIRRVERQLADRGRVVVRYSGTEPLLRIMAEGRDRTEVEAAVADIERAAAPLRIPE